ncbi:hypothetical protein KUCAC02_034153, partial [Chaenocephalus aceratus]
ENAHFVVVDLMLEVLEGKDPLCSYTHKDEVETGSEEVQHPPKTFSILSTDSGFKDGGVDTMQRDSLRMRWRWPSSWCWSSDATFLHKRRGEVVALQHFLCAGCGTELEHRYIKKLRYCDYLGRYFCECCHGGSEAVIPGRVLTCWDFNRYPPLFHLQTLNSRVKELERFREVQDQLMDIQKLLNTCRFSSQVTFDELPAHLMQRCPVFSLDDLQRLKKGQLGSLAKTLLHTALKHVESCELCLARGFICEFCREKDFIFPFQRETCRRCAVCRACFHKHCFVERCPKCERIKSRRKTS